MAAIVIAVPHPAVADATLRLAQASEDATGGRGALPYLMRQPLPSEPVVSTVEEVSYKGPRLKAQLNPADATLKIDLNGKTIGTVPNIGRIKTPKFLSGSTLSLVTIWTNNPEGTCASYVLVAIPAGGKRPEIRPDFGACNMMSVNTESRRGSWELWSML